MIPDMGNCDFLNKGENAFRAPRKREQGSKAGAMRVAWDDHGLD